MASALRDGSGPSPDQPVAGPHDPLPGTPLQAPGSTRRTTTIDTVRPEGSAGAAELVELRGRDRRLDGDGEVVEEVELVLQLTLDPVSGEVVALDAGPDGAVSDLEWLIGGSLSAGFGRRLASALGPELERRTLRASLLEDVPGAFMVAGYSSLRAGVHRIEPEMASQMAGHQADICIGWASGSSMHSMLADRGRIAVPLGPTAPALDGDGAWNRPPALTEGTVRRRRRLDVVREQGDARLTVDSHLRDTYRSFDGDDVEEMVLHEYVVAAAVDGAGRLASISVDPRVLPWSECPGGTTSAQRLVGADLARVVSRARTELVGPTTCTHLTSTLRALADVTALR